MARRGAGQQQRGAAHALRRDRGGREDVAGLHVQQAVRVGVPDVQHAEIPLRHARKRRAEGFAHVDAVGVKRDGLEQRFLGAVGGVKVQQGGLLAGGVGIAEIAGVVDPAVVIVVEIAVRVGARADFLPRAGGGVEPGVDVDGVRQNGFFLLSAAEIGERLVRLDADRQEAASLTGDDLLVGQHRDGLHRVILPVPAVEGAGLMTGGEGAAVQGVLVAPLQLHVVGQGIGHRGHGRFAGGGVDAVNLRWGDVCQLAGVGVDRAVHGHDADAEVAGQVGRASVGVVGAAGNIAVDGLGQGRVVGFEDEGLGGHIAGVPELIERVAGVPDGAAVLVLGEGEKMADGEFGGKRRGGGFGGGL